MASEEGLFERTLVFSTVDKDLVMQACLMYNIDYEEVHDEWSESDTLVYSKDEKNFEKLKESMEKSNVRLRISKSRIIGYLC